MRDGFRMALGVLAATACTCSFAAGILKLSRVEVTLAPGKPANELYVENVGDTPLYLNVEQHWVANPGEYPERLVPITEVARPSLLIQPNRLALAPQQKYRMVMKELSTPTRTQVWRVTFRPEQRVLIDSGQSEDMQTPLFVSIGYGVVIYQRADQEK